MIIYYGMTDENAKLAARIYAEWFPNRERQLLWKAIRKCILRVKKTGSLLQDMQNYSSPDRNFATSVSKKKSFRCLRKILELVFIVQLAYSVYRDVRCIAFYEIIYHFIINACNNCWSEMKHRAFIFVKVFILFIR